MSGWCRCSCRVQQAAWANQQLQQHHHITTQSPLLFTLLYSNGGDFCLNMRESNQLASNSSCNWPQLFYVEVNDCGSSWNEIRATIKGRPAADIAVTITTLRWFYGSPNPLPLRPGLNDNLRWVATELISAVVDPVILIHHLIRICCSQITSFKLIQHAHSNMYIVEHLN